MSYCKFYKEQEQVSYDNGQTWNDIPGADRKGELYEYDSPDCYPFYDYGKITVIYDDGKKTYKSKIECDESTVLTAGDVATSIAPVGGPSSMFIGNCVQRIATAEDNVFDNTITSITLSDSVKIIDYGAFSGDCFSTLKTCRLGNSVETIGASAFKGLVWMTDVNIPDSVTSIGSNAFYDCESLTDIVIPNAVIGERAFSNCGTLTGITLDDSITTIDKFAFFGTAVKSITIPSGVTVINDGVFSACRGLTNVTLLGRITSIGGSFYDCSSLVKFNSDTNGECNIPDSVTTIGTSAFGDCTSLTSINIPSGVTSIGNSAFKGCTSLTAITCSPLTPPSTTFDTYAFDNTNNCPIYVPCVSVDAYKTSPYWNKYADRITCKNQVTDIAITPAAITLNGTSDFALVATVSPSYAKDKRVLWTSSDPTVAIVNENGLVKTVTNGIAIITAKAVDCFDCEASCSVNVSYLYQPIIYHAGVEQSVSIASFTPNAFSHVFSDGIGVVKFTEPVTIIGRQAFQYFDISGELIIPDSVTTIGDEAFMQVGRLTDITIGSGITSIGNFAFAWPKSLNSITIKATTPPTLVNGSAFYGSTCPIYVPSGSVNAYKNASDWNYYSSRIQAIP